MSGPEIRFPPPLPLPSTPGRGAWPEGLILIDKPEGPTSHDAVETVRRALGGPRCGHAGTLDPFASGLLLLAVGRATRLLRFLGSADKTYEGLVRLGLATDTDDRTGRAIGDVRPVAFSHADLSSAVAGLDGEIEQIPPVYSARKHKGVPLYALARKGRVVPRRPVPVRVRWDEIERVGSDLLRFRATVSAGTYLRALARDLGERLGCRGHLAELRRVRSGSFEVEDAIPLTRDREALLRALRPLDAIPLGLDTLVLDEVAAALVRRGRPIPLPDPPGPETGAGTEARSRDPHAVQRLQETPEPGTTAPGSDTRPLPAVDVRAGLDLSGGPAPSGWRRLLDPEGRLLAVAEVAHTPPEGTWLRPRIVFEPLC